MMYDLGASFEAIVVCYWQETYLNGKKYDFANDKTYMHCNAELKVHFKHYLLYMVNTSALFPIQSVSGKWNFYRIGISAI